MTQTSEIVFGRFRFDLGSLELRSFDGELCALRAQSTQVLAVLASHPNETVTKEALFQAVWPDVSVTDDSLTQCVSEIRKALGDSERAILQTIPRLGYQLNVVHAAQGKVAPEAGRFHRHKGLVAVTLAVLTLFVAMTAYFVLRPFAPGQAGARTPTIIILPFKDLSSEADLQHFADGMTEDLITSLSRWKDFDVINRLTAMSFAEEPLTVTEIAERTHANYALQGSVRRIGETLRVTAQFVDGVTGRNLWADQYDETGTDILAVHDGIIQRIEQTLAGNTGELRADEYRKTWSKSATTLDEYDYYLRGHSAFYEFTADGMDRALAIWRDGRSFYPMSGHLKIKEGWGRHLCNQFGCSAGPFDPAETLRLVQDGMTDPALPMAGYRHGLWLLASLASEAGDRATTLSITAELAERFPSDVEGIMLSVQYLVRVGAFEQAGALLDLVGPLNLRPMPYIYAEAGYYHYARGDCVAAQPYLEAGLFPGEALMRAGCHAEAGDIDRARLELDRIADVYGIRTPEAFPLDFTYIPDVGAKLQAQLATVGWPY